VKSFFVKWNWHVYHITGFTLLQLILITWVFSMVFLIIACNKVKVRTNQVTPVAIKHMVFETGLCFIHNGKKVIQVFNCEVGE
jgi:competence protein ComGC